MPHLPSKLPETGENRALYGIINQIVDYCQSLTPVPSFNMATSHAEIGVARSPIEILSKAAKDGSVDVQRFRINEVYDEVLRCYEIDEDNQLISTDDIWIMRPYALWTNSSQGLASGHDGNIQVTSVNARYYNVIRSAGGQSRTFRYSESLIPPYQETDLIFAVRDPKAWEYIYTDTGGTQHDVQWLDLNVDARHWQLDNDVVEVCVQNVLGYTIIQKTSTVF